MTYIYPEFQNALECEVNPLFNPKDKTAYKKALIEVNERFRFALLKKHNVLKNPKAEKAYDIAWEEGHSGGYFEVESYFDRIVELIK